MKAVSVQAVKQTPSTRRMAKSMRCKREKRLKAIKRRMVEPHYDKKDVAKLAAQEAALAAPKLVVKPSPADAAMDVAPSKSPFSNDVDTEMTNDNQSLKSLKPIGKKLKRKIKIAKRKGHGKGKMRRKHV